MTHTTMKIILSMNLTFLQETIPSSISAVVLFGAAVSLASFTDQNEIQCTSYQYYR